MDKIFKITPKTNETGTSIFLEGQGQSSEILTSVIIDSWDGRSWFWKITKEDPKANPHIHTKFMVSVELYIEGNLEYCSKTIAIGQNGTGLVLGSGRGRFRAIDITVANWMNDNDISSLVAYPPTADRVRKGDTTFQVRVFDMDNNEIPAVAGSYMLDKEQGYIIKNRSVNRDKVSEWKTAYIPFGHYIENGKLVKKGPKEEPAPSASMMAVVTPVVDDAIVHEETATVGEEPAGVIAGSAVGEIPAEQNNEGIAINVAGPSTVTDQI